jgi:hypothetical protein
MSGGCLYCGCYLSWSGRGRPRKFCDRKCREDYFFEPTVESVPVVPGREIWMCCLFRAGKTLQEIGDMYNMTRERVRQLLKRHGLDKNSGGMLVNTIEAKAKKAKEAREKADNRCIRIYGCDKATFERLMCGMRRSEIGSPAEAWSSQRSNAKRRGIEWGLSFFEWMTIWNESGKWDQRGLGIGKYCMARKMDSGGYTADNVYITTCDDNVRDYQARLKVDGVVSPDGWLRLPENDRVVTGGGGRTREEVMGREGICRYGHKAERDRYGNCIECRRARRRKYYENRKLKELEETK